MWPLAIPSFKIIVNRVLNPLRHTEPLRHADGHFASAALMLWHILAVQHRLNDVEGTSQQRCIGGHIEPQPVQHIQGVCIIAQSGITNGRQFITLDDRG
jgi:hypothetical protein